jgi:beta-glucanase (GH16 family)
MLPVMLLANGLVVVMSTASTAADETRVTFVNRTGETLWIGAVANADGSREIGGLPTLSPGASASIVIPDQGSPAHWRGRFFARQRCSGEPGSTFHCQVGDCGNYADRCVVGGQPASLAEFNFDRNDGLAPWYDVSYVDAVSLEITIETPGAGSRPPAGTCARDCLGGALLAACPEAYAVHDPQAGDRVLCVNPNRDAETDYTAALRAFGPRAYLWSTHDRMPGNETVYNCPGCREFVVTFHGKGAGATGPRTVAPVAAENDGWTEVFVDEFDGPEGSLPDASRWRLSTGHGYPGGPANWGTGEIQRYTDDPANVSLDGRGHLRITPQRDANGEWTSARVETNQQNFKAPPGGVLRIEGRIQVPNVTGAAAAGYWPAFWALGAPYRGTFNWPAVGEIDVMENVNGINAVWGVLHCGTNPGGPCNEPNGIGAQTACPGRACQDAFHVYTVDWDRSSAPEQLRWYVDGQQYHSVRQDQVDAATWRAMTDHEGVFLLLNVAIGGGFPAAYGGGPTAATAPGRSMFVDYVRVLTKGGAPPAPSPSSVPTTTAASSTAAQPRPSSVAPRTEPTLAVDFLTLASVKRNGSATLADGRLVLASGPWDGGSAWVTRISPSQSWNASFVFEVSDVSDGLAFVLQAKGPNALGSYGGALGYGHDSDPNARIAPSVAIEFDAWSNHPDGYDPPTQHVGITVDGDMKHHLATADPGFSLHSQGPVHAWVSYDAASRTLRVWASRSATKPAAPLLTVPIDLTARLGSGLVYVGFTGSTGRIMGTQPRTSVLSWSLMTA